VDSTIRLGQTREKRALNGGEVLLAEATVTWMTTGFKKIRFYGLDSIGWGKLNLPPQHLETVTFGIVPGCEAIDALGRYGLRVVEGLAGIRNLLLVVLPLHAMCDPSNLGGVVESSNLGCAALFIYDRFPKGLGLSEKGFGMGPEVLAAARELAEGCPCADGCPSCVGQPRPPLLHYDPDLMQGYPIPNKEAAIRLLAIFGRALP
jgi:DEAD/DEAH box helicase domain-containing protein